MTILFVYSVDDILTPERPLRTQEEMQFGISCISAVLKQHGHRTHLVVTSRVLGKDNASRIRKAIDACKPQAVFFTAVASEYGFIVSLVRQVKAEYPGLYLVAGGAHVSLNPDGVLDDGFDALCVGEGEYPALELVTKLEAKEPVSGIPNIWARNGGRIERNAPRPFLQDLDSLPHPDREMWRGWTADEGGESAVVLLGRGCPFQCTYCCNHALRRLAQGTYVRFRSPASIVAEIRAILAASPGLRSVYLEVETIGANRAWALDLCAHLEDLNRTLARKLSFGTNLRVTPQADLEPLFAAFRRSNFSGIKIGVESGSERVRGEILKRHYSNRDIEQTVACARRHGLTVSFYNLLGVPGETLADFRETVALNRACQPEKAFAHIFFPYPGTELYETCRRKGLLDGMPPAALERCRATLDLPGFRKRDIQRGFVWFEYDVYKGRRPMRQILAKVIVSKCRSHERLHALYRHLTCSGLMRRLRSGSRPAHQQ